MTAAELAIPPVGPMVLPATWRRIDHPMGLECYAHVDGLVVIITEENHADGKTWLHVSCSRRARLPSWDDLKMVKAIFIGRDKEALQVLPPRIGARKHPPELHAPLALPRWPAGTSPQDRPGRERKVSDES